MKAISLWQPWSSAIAVGVKHNETRSWVTPYRGPIAIHAGRRADWNLEEFFDQMMLRGDFKQAMERANLHSFTMLPKGAVVAVADLVEIVSTEMAWAKGLPELERLLGDYSQGRYAWRLANVRPLREPYFARGCQGLFDVPDAELTSRL